MRNIDQNTITEAFLARLDGCDNARLKEVISALVRHVHEFAREVKLTPAEWMAGIEFLTQTGQTCTAERQEFILLSDTLGLSMLLVALNEHRSPEVTESTVLGPFHVDDAPALAPGSDISGGAHGTPMNVQITVRSSTGQALADASVDVWQSDDEGLYDVQKGGHERSARAVMRTDAQGRLNFRCIVPTAYPVPTDGPVGRMLVATGRHPWRPAHVHFLIEAADHETLITHLFREGDPYLDSDVVFGVRNTLVVPMPVTDGVGQLRYDFMLQRSDAAQERRA